MIFSFFLDIYFYLLRFFLFYTSVEWQRIRNVTIYLLVVHPAWVNCCRAVWQYVRVVCWFELGSTPPPPPQGNNESGGTPRWRQITLQVELPITPSPPTPGVATNHSWDGTADPLPSLPGYLGVVTGSEKAVDQWQATSRPAASI